MTHEAAAQDLNYSEYPYGFDASDARCEAWFRGWRTYQEELLGQAYDPKTT